MFFRETLRGIPLPDPASAAPPGRTPPAPYPPLCRMVLRLSGLREDPVSPYTVGPASAAPPGDTIRHGAALLPGGGWRLTRPTGASHRLTPRRPGKRSATGRCHQARSRFIAGWRLAPYPAYDSRNLSLIYSPVLLKLPVLRPQHR